MSIAKKENNGYFYSRLWFDFSFENNDIITPTHTAMYLWFVELNNRMGWSEKFASPASQTMAAIGLKSYNTYKKIFDELVKFGFIIVVTASKNQYSACIVALSKFDKAHNKALDKALTKHMTKQSESTHQSTDSIVKQETIKIKNKEPQTLDFDIIPKIKTELDLAFDEFIKMRNKTKKITDHAVVLIKKKTLSLSKGDDKIGIEIINQSIINSWSDVYPLKINNNKNDTTKSISPPTGKFKL